MEKNQPQIAHKVTLSSGKEVYLREPKIKHTELAAQAAGPKAGSNNHLMVMLMQKELLKQLIVQVDGKLLKPLELEDLDSILTAKEYGQLLHMMERLTGDQVELGKCQIEVVTSGGN